MGRDNFIIREYRESDFNTILEMESSRGGDPYSHAVFIRQMAVLFPQLFIIALNKNGDIIGYTLGGINAGEPKSGLVMRIFVAPGFRRYGAGGLLMDELEKRFSQFRVVSVSLTVSPLNEGAVRLYEKFGFARSDYIKDYFGKGEDRIVMTAPYGGKIQAERS
jgi:ribosomal-protein-alanine N-acetyltransferase